MRLRRQSRLLAVILMLLSMLMMQVAIASCRCLESELDQLYLATAAGAEHARVPETHAHHEAALMHDHGPQHEGKSSCDNCPESQQLSKRLASSIDHPEVTPFMPSALIRVLAPAQFAVTPASATPHADIHIHATAPPVCIRDCTFQL